MLRLSSRANCQRETHVVDVPVSRPASTGIETGSTFDRHSLFFREILWCPISVFASVSLHLRRSSLPSEILQGAETLPARRGAWDWWQC
jgi:hypothetical protein